MTTKQKHISEILQKLYEISNKANAEASVIWNQLEDHIKELTDYAQAVGIQIGINRCLSIITDLWDKAMEENENE